MDKARNMPHRESIADKLRIVGAIVTKDLLEALRNKNTIAVIFTSLFVVFAYRALPSLTSAAEKQAVLVHDAGSSMLAALLENGQNYEVYEYSSEQEMKAEMGDTEVPELAISIPTGFDQALDRGESPQLRGYAIHWLRQQDIDALKSELEAEINRLVGVDISIQMQAERVYNTPESGGLGMWATLSLVFLITMIGMTLIPHLMMEEKQTHTLEALLVSPASAGKVIGAKAIVGLVYCMVCAGVTMALYNRLVTHWWVLILTAIVLSLFAVSIGLLLGVIVENRGQLTLWAWVFLVPFMLPIFLALLEGLLPDTLIQVFRYIPTVVAFNLARSSYAGTISTQTILLQLTWVAAWAGALLLGVAWLVNRRDRDGTFVPSVWSAHLDTPAAETVAANTPGVLTTFAASLPWLQRKKEEPLKTREDPSQANAASDAAGLPQGLRIISTIAGKDIRDALQNKLVIAIILGALIMVATSSVLPLLLRLQGKPAAIVYENGRSTIIRGLTGQEDFILGLSDSVQEMEQRVIELPMSPVGLVIPPDFDQKAGGEEVIEIEARTAHWSNPELVAQRVAFFEQRLSEASWSPVKINLAAETLYPTAETGGQPMIAALLLVVGLLTIGIALVPLLMVEEKESHTFEALLVSPASFSQIVSGKALAGAFYASLMVLSILLLNVKMFVHWEVVLLAAVFGVGFAVAIGLLVGVISDTPTTASLWGSSLLLVLIMPAVAWQFNQAGWSPLIRTVLEWSPSTAILNLFSISMMGELPNSLLRVNLLVIGIWVCLIFGLVWWSIRRSER